MSVLIDIFNCCDICGEDHPTEQCPELGEIPVDSHLGAYITRARLTLPNSFELLDNRIGIVGVLARELIPARTQLGPFEAKKTTHVFDDTGFFTLKLISKDGNFVCLDTTDENDCNWLCLVRPAIGEDTQNCMAYQLGTNIFYNALRDIFPGEELQVWYTPTYARKLGKSVHPDGVSKALLGHRIEPIQSEVVGEPFANENTEFIQQEQEQIQAQPSAVTEGNQELRGEIKKAFCCPRCPSNFASQTSMVQHLREHVISGNKPLVGKKKGKGRPRIHPIGETLEPSVKRPRGRPRKVKQPDEYLVIEGLASESIDETEYTADGEGKDHEENDDYDKVIDGEENEVVNDESLNTAGPPNKKVKLESDVVDDDNDTDYSPVIDVTSSGRRIQPRRNRKGLNRHLMQDYIVGKIKKEPVDVTEDEQTVNELSDTTSIDRPTIEQASIKRKRGRPKKSEQLKFQTEIQQVVNGLLDSGSNTEEIDNNELNPSSQDQSNIRESADSSMKDSDNTLTVRQETLEDESKPELVNNENHTVSNIDKEVESVCNVDETAVVEVSNTSEGTDDAMEEKTEELGSDEREGTSVELNVLKEESKHMLEVKSTEVILDNEETTALLPDGDGADKSDSGNVSVELVVQFDEDTGFYSCLLCDEKFNQEVGAAAHMASHNTDSTFHCMGCEQGFSSALELKAHLPECIKPNNKPDNNLTSNKKVMNGDQSSVDSAPHICDMCQQEFKTAKYLYRHMVMHTDIFSCRVCYKTFSRKDSMQKHVLKCCPGDAKRLKILHCDLCLRVFSTVSGRKKHMAVCTLVQCERCGSRFSSKEDLGDHKCKDGKTEDSGAGRYSCGKCPKSFQSLHYLKQHSMLHKKLHACSRCGKSLPSKDELESHSLTCQTIESIKLLGQGRCERCGEVFNRVKMFREHALSHTHPYQCEHCLRRFIKVGTLSSHDCVSQNESFKCQTCSKSFKTEPELDQHVKDHGCMRYQCSACGKQFYMKAEARDHECEEQLEPADDVERKIIYTSDSKEVCATCGKTFATRSNLVKHMTLHGDKNFPCPHCEKRFHLDVYLKEHITCVHYKIYKYQCQKCGKMLKSKTGLNMHTMLFHSSKSERFPCKECLKVFKSKGNLKAHMYKHSSGRGFKCNLCQRAFKFPDQLSRHKVEHKIVEKLSCLYCEKQFCRRYELKRHLQIYHSGYVYVCGVCSAKCSHRHTLVRHYKRKHADDYHLLSQEGYLNNLLKHITELSGSGNGFKELAPGEQVPLPAQQDLELLPQEAVKALHSLSLGTCTPKEYEILQKKGLVMSVEGAIQQNPVEPPGENHVIITDEGLESPAMAAEDQLLSNVSDQLNLNLNNQVNLIQSSDGTINLNNIPGLPQTLQTLEGNEGQIVILQIVEATDQMATQFVQGEIIQQVQVGTNESMTIQQQEALQGSEPIREPHTSVPGEVQIVNFSEALDVSNGTVIEGSADDGQTEHVIVTNTSSGDDGQTVTEGSIDGIQTVNETSIDNGQTEHVTVIEGSVDDGQTEHVIVMDASNSDDGQTEHVTVTDVSNSDDGQTEHVTVTDVSNSDDGQIADATVTEGNADDGPTEQRTMINSTVDGLQIVEDGLVESETEIHSTVKEEILIV